MKVNFSSLLKFVLFLSLGLFLIWLSVKNISPEQRSEMMSAFSDMKYQWLALSAVFALLSHVSRSFRWKMMLDPLVETGKKPSILNCFFILMVGYFANLAFPRLGEAMRCGLMQRYEKISFDKVLGTVVVDRFIDIITLGLLFVFVLVFERNRLGGYVQEDIINPILSKLGATAGASIFLLGGLVLLAGIGFFFLKKMGFLKKLIGVLGNLKEGLLSVSKLKNFPVFIFHSFFIWFMYFAMVYICFFSNEMTATLPPIAGLATVVFGAFAVVATPGGIGAYPIVVQSILGQYGLESFIAYGFGTIIWVIQTFTIIVVGFLCLVALPIFNRDGKA